jgi:hypothetical protein
MSEWAIIELYHGENKLHSDETMLMSALFGTKMPGGIFIKLRILHWNSLRIDNVVPLGCIIMIYIQPTSTP